MCLSNQQHIESILTLIVEIRKNPELWSSLCEKVKNKTGSGREIEYSIYVEGPYNKIVEEAIMAVRISKQIDALL